MKYREIILGFLLLKCKSLMVEGIKSEKLRQRMVNAYGRNRWKYLCEIKAVLCGLFGMREKKSNLISTDSNGRIVGNLENKE